MEWGYTGSAKRCNKGPMEMINVFNGLKERQDALEQDMEVVKGNMQKHDNILATHESRLKSLEDKPAVSASPTEIEHVERLVRSRVGDVMKKERM